MKKIEEMIEQLSLLEHILEVRFLQERSQQASTIIEKGHVLGRVLKEAEETVKWNVCSRKSG
ncbi:MAG: hypothetical protein R3328_03195 [Planococcaceae bacterium]|jgi:hypothetical protein|uniref:hypothetical protein n=1 Tax=Paenisporosarcina quisquiliarum TaxID=365346 RepID=UPI002420F0E4|nr:hypothetical protein [Bacillota bacterium]MDX1770517.1 hypothetical protein [Planococcaceae bacterium]